MGRCAGRLDAPGGGLALSITWSPFRTVCAVHPAPITSAHCPGLQADEDAHMAVAPRHGSRSQPRTPRRGFAVSLAVAAAVSVSVASIGGTAAATQAITPSPMGPVRTV